MDNARLECEVLCRPVEFDNSSDDMAVSVTAIHRMDPDPPQSDQVLERYSKISVLFQNHEKGREFGDSLEIQVNEEMKEAIDRATQFVRQWINATKENPTGLRRPARLTALVDPIQFIVEFGPPPEGRVRYSVDFSNGSGRAVFHASEIRTIYDLYAAGKPNINLGNE